MIFSLQGSNVTFQLKVSFQSQVTKYRQLNTQTWTVAWLHASKVTILTHQLISTLLCSGEWGNPPGSFCWSCGSDSKHIFGGCCWALLEITFKPDSFWILLCKCCSGTVESAGLYTRGDRRSCGRRCLYSAGLALLTNPCKTSEVYSAHIHYWEERSLSSGVFSIQ